MPSARSDLRKRSQKKKLIAGLTLMLLLLLVSLLGGLSSQMSKSNATTGVPVPSAPAALPGVVAHPTTPPRPLPRPNLALARPPLTPAEEILMEIARYGGSATAADYTELPVAGSEPPLVAALSPAPEISGPADYPWPRLPHDSLLPPRRLAGGSEDCSCEGTAPPCPEDEWPLIADNDPGPEEVWSPIGDGPADPDLGIPGPDGPPPVPEPATLLLVGMGLTCLAGLGRQRKRPA